MSDLSKEEFESQATFRYAIRKFLRTSEQNARDAGITPQHYHLMLVIKGMKGRDWATISEVAEALQINHHTAVGLCKRAESNKLIRRSAHETDGRSICLKLSARGEKIVNSIARQNRFELAKVWKDILQMFVSIWMIVVFI